MNFTRMIARLFVAVLPAVLVGAWHGAALAQTTAFAYQARLNDNSMPANAAYDFQFKLFDALAGGNQIGTTNTLTNVTVSSGLFSVTLDFGAAAFPGAARFLEISLRLAGGGAFTTLTPRRPINSTPQAIRSLQASSADALSASCVVCVTDAQIAAVAGGKVTGTVSSATNATNATTAVNFSGALAGEVTGTQAATVIANGAVTNAKLADGSVTNAKIVDVAGSKVTGTIPVAGVPVGSGNYIQNFTGVTQAGASFNISGNGTAGGTLSGNIVNATTQFNLNGSRILGIGPSNDLFAGLLAGAANPSGGNNTFIGTSAGLATTTGGGNLFAGTNAGNTNTTGTRNTTIGFNAQVSSSSLSNATAIGADAQVGCSNCLVLGTISAISGNNTNVGIGTTNPSSFRLQVNGHVGPDADNISDLGSFPLRWRTIFAGNGVIQTSDARLKQKVSSLSYGLHALMQLHPVSFEWKDNTDQRRHLGLLAQETEAVIPEAVVRDKDPAAPLGMSYTELIPVVIKSVQEQQQQIAQLQQQNTQLREQNAALQKGQVALEARLAALEKRLPPTAPGNQ